MRVHIICTSPPQSVYGNRITAERWSKMFHDLGHSVECSQHYGGTICDLLVAMHADQTSDAVVQFHKRHPDKRIILVLTGTDVYRDGGDPAKAHEAMRIADRLVTFQPLAVEAVPEEFRSKVRMIYQSAEPTLVKDPPERNSFVISVVGRLHQVKDPLRPALAARSLPSQSRIRIVHAGDANGAGIVTQAREEAIKNPRYRYIGSIPRWKVRRLIASSHLLVLSSLVESGPNVISEAIVDYVPLLATKIPGNVGLLGEEFPGYYPPADTGALASLLAKAEGDRYFYQELKTSCALLARLFRPEREQASWEKLIREISKPKR